MKMWTDEELARQDRAYDRAELDAETDAPRRDAFEADLRADLKTAHGMLNLLHHYSGSLHIEKLCALLVTVKEKDAGPFVLLSMRHELLELETGYVEDCMAAQFGDKV